MIMRDIIVLCGSLEEWDRLYKFIEENNECNYISSIKKYGRTFMNQNDVGIVISCASEKAQFKLQLTFETRDYVV